MSFLDCFEVNWDREIRKLLIIPFFYIDIPYYYSRRTTYCLHQVQETRQETTDISVKIFHSLTIS